eukprot:TRINITY_DN6173_c0_g2_i1.p1 TRINITY_DN6173_c0_g2~~TRINITY_DN6173_c0_g2_i1.p1  ORF type:complete len:586 (-),score=66.50 TRINITY_DN6173_c0_g2_i1:445-2013(-)
MSVPDVMVYPERYNQIDDEQPTNNQMEEMEVDGMSSVDEEVVGQYNVPLSPQEIRNMQILKGLQQCRSPYTMTKLLVQEGSAMNEVHTAITATSLAKMVEISYKHQGIDKQRNFKELYEIFLGLCQQHYEFMTANQLCQCAWSLGKAVKVMRLNNQLKNIESTFDTLLRKLLEERVDELDAKDFGYIVNGIINIECRDQKLIQRTLEIGSQMEHLTAMTFVNMLMMMSSTIIANSSFNNPEFVANLIRYHSHLISQMDAKTIVNFCVSSKKLRFKDDAICQSVQNTIIKNNLSFVPFQVVLVLEMLSEYERINKGILRKFTKAYLGKDFDPRNFERHAQIVYNFALVDCPVKYVQEVVDKITWEESLKLPSNIVMKFKAAQLRYQRNGKDLQFPISLEKLNIQQNRFVQADILSRFFRNHFQDVSVMLPQLDGLITIDVAIKLRSCSSPNQDDEDLFVKIAIVILNDENTYSNDISEPVKEVVDKCEMLQQNGWQIVRVYWNRWASERYQTEILSLIQGLRF